MNTFEGGIPNIPWNSREKCAESFRVSPAAFTVEGGELTASLKVKRHTVAQKYAALIEAMYVS